MIQSIWQYGGVGTIHIDRDLAPFVRISFLNHYKEGLKYLSEDNKTYEDFKKLYGDSVHTASIVAPVNIFKSYNNKAYKYALDMLEKEGASSQWTFVYWQQTYLNYMFTGKIQIKIIVYWDYTQ